ncbi:DNA phosphorothioation system sulfurtransferase DndC [Chloroflexota bacterium]
MTDGIWQKIEDDIIDQYVNDQSQRPWVIAFSGGKDSTTLLQVVWNSISKIKTRQRTRDIHIVCNNTLVENPVIISYVKKQLDSIRTAAIEQSMPVTVEHTIPSMNNTFWVNLIGRGYVAPNSLFRWCTERLKIKPTSKYIQEKVTTYGEVIILLGTRKAESSTRSRSIKRYEVKGKRLNKHNLPGAHVYAPLKNVSTNDVWWYLAQNVSPWHSDNNDLVHIYRNASDDNDCPLITDKSTPACGQSRFGCWVCTVVSSDKSMQNLISTGDHWMQPLLEFRNMLAETINRDRIDYDPLKYRMPIRRNTQEGLGPYWPRWRQNILKRLLETQKIVQQTKSNIQLITEQELVAIQVIWDRDFISEYGVAATYAEVYDSKIDPLSFDKNRVAVNELLQSACYANPSDVNLINSLLIAKRNKMLLVNKRGLQNDIEKIIDEHLNPNFTNVYKEDHNK